MYFANPLLLLGLVAVLIPPVVHILSRRRYDEVDWGATQFLRVVPRARRRVFVEQWLLLALRATTLALLATALAGPTIRAPFRSRIGSRTPQATAILIDVSASMGGTFGDRTGADAARGWANAFIDRLHPGDRVALFAVKRDTVPMLAEPTDDRLRARAALELLPTPTGSADWPRAVEAAAGWRDVLILTDGQKFGWADASAVARWEHLVRHLTDQGSALPRLWIVDVTAGRTPRPVPAVTAFTTRRTVATGNAAVRFEGTLTRASGATRLRVAVDGRPVGEAPLRLGADGEARFEFTRTFAAGSHVVTVVPADDTSPDGSRHLAIDVFPPHAVLIVDGDPRPEAAVNRGSDYLRRALAPANDPSPTFTARVIPISRFAPPELSSSPIGGTPRVLILANVESLTAEQGRCVESFVAAGGGVLVTPGDRTNAAGWSRATDRNGSGWMPATLLATQAPTSPAQPSSTGVVHPVLNMFRDNTQGGLHAALFPRYWKLRPSAPPVLSFTNGDPMLAEKCVGRGRVILTAVPFDTSWDSNLVRLPDFVPLVHELTHYLATSSVVRTNLAAGEAIVFHPPNETPDAVVVVPPDGRPRTVPVKEWPAVFEATTDPGVYRVSSAAGHVRHYVVSPDPRERDPTQADPSENARVVAMLGGVEEVSTLEELSARRGRLSESWDVGDVLLVMVLGLFAAELWCARRAGAA